VKERYGDKCDTMDSIIDDVEMMRSGDKSVPCHAIGYYNVR
jgi:hypothetical protein